MPASLSPSSHAALAIISAGPPMCRFGITKAYAGEHEPGDDDN